MADRIRVTSLIRSRIIAAEVTGHGRKRTARTDSITHPEGHGPNLYALYALDDSETARGMTVGDGRSHRRDACATSIPRQLRLRPQADALNHVRRRVHHHAQLAADGDELPPLLDA